MGAIILHIRIRRSAIDWIRRELFACDRRDRMRSSSAPIRILRTCIDDDAVRSTALKATAAADKSSCTSAVLAPLSAAENTSLSILSKAVCVYSFLDMPTGTCCSSATVYVLNQTCDEDRSTVVEIICDFGNGR